MVWVPCLLVVLLFAETRYIKAGVLKVTGLNFANSTQANNATFSSNSSLPTNISITTTATPPSFRSPKSNIPGDVKNSIKSEIYKMHNNGLMLLHPQRSGNGLGIKKSELFTKEDSNIIDSVNYHVWKKIDKQNETSSVVENEELLEKKLGNLPQVNEGKREMISLPKSENKKTIICYSGDVGCVERKRRSFDDPLFDDDQPEEILRRYKEKRRLLQKLNNDNRNAYDRNIPDIPAIAAIPNIRSRFEKIDPLEHVPRFSPFGSALDNWPRFGVPDLQLMHYPRFAAPKMDEFEQVPGIPHIRPLSRGDEVTGDKRDFPAKNDEFYDRELDEDIEHYSPITSPTEIPSLTNIPDIQDIQDIPTIKPAPAKPQNSGGTNGKMPVVDTINTKEGKETRVSA